MTDFKKIIELKQARTRCWAVWLSHLVCAPIASVVYATKTEYWKPTIFATGIAIVGIPLAVIDMGITSAFVAPVTSAGMLVSKVTESRRKRDIYFPEAADQQFYEAMK